MHVKLVIIFVTTWCQIGLHAEQDNNPLVTRRRMFIYRIVEDVQVEYTQCRYFDSKHPAVAYSDITENCIKALDSGTFKDKWGEENNVGSSVIKLTRYITIADPIRNEIKLKSGTICRYDRGFCYDDKEKENTAFVWKVERNTDKNSVKACPGKVEQLFYGSVDIWEFPRERLKYLFYSDIASSKAFYLRLKDKVKCSNVDTWNTEGNDFVISSLKLTSQIKKTTTINEHYLPLQPIEKVSEDLMKNRDLQKYPLDFNPPITNEYFEEPDNLKIMFRKLREEMKVETSKAIKSGENSLNIKSISNKIHEFDRLIIERDTKIEQINGTLLSMGDRLVETNGYIRSVQNLLDISSSKCNQDVANLKETFLESSARTSSENKQSLELAVGESIILGRKLKMLEDFVKKQASIYLTEAEIEKKIFSLKEVSNEKIKELDNKLQSIVELDEQYNSSLKDIQNECRGIDGRIGNLLNNFDSKLNIIEQSVTGNFTFVKNKFGEIARKFSDIENIPQEFTKTNNKIENLERKVKELQLKSENSLQYFLQNVNKKIEETNLLTKGKILNLENQLNNLAENIIDIDWDVLRNLKGASISSEDFNTGLAQLEERLNGNIEELGKNYTMRLDQHELGLENCNERLDDIDRKNLGMLKEVQRNILLETKAIVKTVEEALKSELDKTMLNLKNQSTNYRDRINHEVLDKLHGMDERIKVFEADLAAQVKILKAKDDAIESRLKILEDLLIPEVEILDS